jgi:two-component system, sensor histidine kinase and response regulator
LRIGAQTLAKLAGDCWTLATRLAPGEATWREVGMGLLASLDDAACGALVVGPDERVLLANHCAYALFEYPDGGLIGVRLGEFVPGQVHGAQAGRRLGGHHFPAELGRHVLQLAGGAVTLVTVFDATERLLERGRDATSAAIVASSTDAVVAKNLEGLITSWNPAAEHIFGYSMREAIGRPVTILFPPDRLAEELEILDRVQRGETVSNLLTTRLRKDGRPIAIALSVSPIRDAQGNVVGAAKIARDVTRQREAEREAAQLAALNAAILENATFAIATISPQGIYLSFNRAAELALGYRAEELVGRQSVAIVHDGEELKARARELGRRLGREIEPGVELFLADAREGRPSDQRWTFIRRDGSRFTGRLSVGALRGGEGEVIGYVGFMFDLSDLRSAEAVAARESERIATILENAIDGIHILDGEGRLVFYSSSFARLLGRSAAQMRGLRAADWQCSQHEGFSALQADAATQQSIETRYRRLDGSEVDVEVSIKGVLLGGQRFLYASARDISPRKLLEQERLANQQRLEHANQELEEFASAASHDLRSPLRGASMVAEWILEDDPALSPETRARLRVIQERMLRMGRLLDDILEYARVDQSRAVAGNERVRPDQLLHEVLGLVALPPGMRVELAPALATLPPVPRMPLQRVFANLIDNAGKHHDRTTGTIKVAGSLRGQRLQFTITDDGPGIPEAYRETVFTMFRTLRPRDAMEGSGMGLALVRKLLASGGGECGVRPAPGRGSEFWFDWPLQAPGEDEAANGDPDENT